MMSQLKITPKLRKFLSAFRRNGNVAQSAAIAGIDRCYVHARRNDDEHFRVKFDDALEEAIEWMEAEAGRRAVEGISRLKFHQGEMIMIPDPSGKTEMREIWVKKGRKWIAEKKRMPVMIPYIEHEYSDALLMFLLKSKRPDIYRDNVKMDVNGGLDITATLQATASALPSKAELLKMIEEETKLLPEPTTEKTKPVTAKVVSNGQNGHKTNGRH